MLLFYTLAIRESKYNDRSKKQIVIFSCGVVLKVKMDIQNWNFKVFCFYFICTLFVLVQYTIYNVNV